jgi:hypothetical protein
MEGMRKTALSLIENDKYINKFQKMCGLEKKEDKTIINKYIIYYFFLLASQFDNEM